MKKSIAILLFVIYICCMVGCCADGIDGVEINSRSAYMINLDSNQVMLNKNADKKMEPASLTKIMTVLVAIESCDDIENERVHIADDSIFYEIKREGGSNIALKAGETLSVKDLLYATMLPSACDAAELLAYHFGGGDTQKFVDMMNQRAKEIGAVNTEFKNAHGLNADGHITTAYDMALIACEALKNEQFKQIISSSTYTIPATEKSDKRDIKYSVELVNRQSANYYRYAVGLKTGFTDQAGRCLVTLATKDGATYLLVLMGANLDGEPTPIKTYTDAKSLFEYVFNAYSLVPIAKSGDVIAETEVYFSDDNTDTIRLLAKQDINLLLPNGVTADMVDKNYNYRDDLSLPLTDGEPLGEVVYSLDGKKLSCFEFVSGDNIYDTMPEGGLSFYPAQGFNKVTLYKLLLIVGIVLCVVGILALIGGNRRKNAKRKPPIRKRNIKK